MKHFYTIFFTIYSLILTASDQTESNTSTSTSTKQTVRIYHVITHRHQFFAIKKSIEKHGLCTAARIKELDPQFDFTTRSNSKETDLNELHNNVIHFYPEGYHDYYIQVDPNTTYVYNSNCRNMKQYQASRLLLARYLQQSKDPNYHAEVIISKESIPRDELHAISDDERFDYILDDIRKTIETDYFKSLKPTQQYLKYVEDWMRDNKRITW